MSATREPHVARLTWQAGEMVAVVASLGRRLGFELGTMAPPGRSLRLQLGEDAVDVVPWRREGPADEPAVEGRLVFEPAGWGGGEAVAGGTADRGRTPDAPGIAVPFALAGVAWATVDLDRAADELGPWLLPDEAAGGAPAHDLVEPHLGARARRHPTAALPGSVIVLLEPTTEGRLAASLARDGEGPCALYVRPPGGLDAWVAGAGRRGILVSSRRDGPFGPSVLVPGAAVAGPHLVIVDRPEPPSPAREPGTIAP